MKDYIVMAVIGTGDDEVDIERIEAVTQGMMNEAAVDGYEFKGIVQLKPDQALIIMERDEKDGEVKDA